MEKEPFEEAIRKIVGGPNPRDLIDRAAQRRGPAAAPSQLDWVDDRIRRFDTASPQGAAAAGSSGPAHVRRRTMRLMLAGVAVLAGVGGLIAWELNREAALSQPPAAPSQAQAQAGAGSAKPADGSARPLEPPPSQAETAASTPTAKLAPGDSAYLESQKAAAQGALEAYMPESRGLLYRDVLTVVSADTQSVSFCGQVNSVNPTGAYIGYQRFISSANWAQVEDFSTPGDFSEAWRERCFGRQGPQIWR